MSVAKVIVSNRTINEGSSEPGLERARPDAAVNDHAGTADAGTAPAAPVRPVVIAGLVGAACGALAAVAVGLVGPGLYPPLDRRVGPLAERGAGLDGEIAKTATALGPLQTELAGLYSVTGAITERVAAGEGQAASRIDRLQDALAQQIDVMAVGSPIFAVAVGRASQHRADRRTLRGRARHRLHARRHRSADRRCHRDAGRAVAHRHPVRRRAPGVASETTAGRQASLSAPIEPTTTTAQSLLSSYTGLTVEPYSIEAARDLLVRADLRLGAQDVASAGALLHELNSTVGAAMAPWSRSRTKGWLPRRRSAP